MAAPDPKSTNPTEFRAPALEGDSPLRNSPHLFYTLVENLREAVCLTADDGLVIYANPQAHESFGYERGALTGRPISERCGYETEECAQRLATVFEYLQTHTAWTGEWLNRTQDGRVFTTFARISAIDLDSRKCFLFVHEEVQPIHQALQDLTARETQLMTLIEASTALLESPEPAAVLRRVLDISRMIIEADAYSIWRREDGLPEIWRAVSSYGLSPAYERTAAAAAPPNLPSTPIPIEDVESSPLTRTRIMVYRSEGIKSFLTVPLRLHDEMAGTLVFYYRTPKTFSAAELKLGAALGNIAASAIQTADLCDRQNTLRKAAEETEHRASLLAGAGEILADSLDTPEILDRIAALAARSFADWVAADLFEAGQRRRSSVHQRPEAGPVTLTAEHLRELDGVEREAVQSGQAKLVYLSAPDDGPQPSHACLLVPVGARGQHLGLLTLVIHARQRSFDWNDLRVAEDLARRISGALERRAAERELRRTNDELVRLNEDLKQFAYSASHDLQEPLRMVALYNQLLRRKYGHALDADAARYIQHSIDGAHRMELLVNDLLAYTQTADLKGVPDKPVDLNTLLQDIVQQLQPEIAATGTVLHVMPLPAVRVHATHLWQLFQNLIANAIKYRSRDAPEIRISARREDEMWVFAVQDNGIGVPAEYRDLVFGLFKRLHGRTDYPGTGIGLALCRRIVERYGGRIWIEQQDQPGSTFAFTLPDNA